MPSVPRAMQGREGCDKGTEYVPLTRINFPQFLSIWFKTVFLGPWPVYLELLSDTGNPNKLRRYNPGQLTFPDLMVRLYPVRRSIPILSASPIATAACRRSQTRYVA